MPNIIETNPIEGFKVYGQQMVEYTVDGVDGRDFSSAIAIASLAEASAIEVEADAYAAVLRTRQRKLSELGDALSTIAKALATMKTGSGQQSKDKSDADDNLIQAQSILNKYGVYNLSLEDGNKVTRGVAEKARSNTEYYIDTEDNDLQQDLITMQGLISKRDNSFTTAARVLKKANSTGSTIIRSIGG